ncbi:MAG: sporulation protein [Oscillospiraceae bacterium]|nr:sporulation protein [Oscillospiraceae bacterium]
MQARTRRNRVAILVSITLCLTSTCEMQGDRFASQRSRAANIAYAATIGDFGNGSDAQAGSETAAGSRSPYAGADAYEVADWWKADISEYDGSLTLISYEAAYTEPDDPLTMTTAVTTDTILDLDYGFYEEPDINFSENIEYESVETTAAALPSVVTTVQEPVTTAPQTVQAIPGSVVFHSSGYGHGVGMSQNGANFYAMYDGWTYDQILSFYYPGTTLVRRSNVENESMTVSGKTDSVLSILSQICYNEMGGSFSVEAIKAQAVAAYSFYLYNGKAAGMICKPNPPQRVVDAVQSVLGIAVYYNNAPALTTFYASSGGATANCSDIFYGSIPYLVSIPVRHDDTSDPNYSSTKVFSVSSLKSKLQNAYHVQLSGNPYDWIQLEYGDGGYVANAVIGGQVRVKGNELRNVLGLKSPKFSFVYEDASSGTEQTTAAPL